MKLAVLTKGGIASHTDLVIFRRIAYSIRLQTMNDSQIQTVGQISWIHAAQFKSMAEPTSDPTIFCHLTGQKAMVCVFSQSHITCQDAQPK